MDRSALDHPWLPIVSVSLAHIELGDVADAATGVADSWGFWVVVGFLIFSMLTVEHLVVLHGRGAVAAKLRKPAAVTAAVVLIAGGAIVVAEPAPARQNAELLPDLISDPPLPGPLKQILDQSGNPRLVVTFDGFVHNVGPGPLDVVGNPQLPAGSPGAMVQRVRDGDDWIEVASPTIRYETSDGHDHFHLIEAIEYVLWNHDQGAQSAIGSKVGFCLVDSEQVETGNDQGYSEELDNFCEEANPGATSLRMGITPGWRDIYDATTTLQWVDVSETDPGRYWIGAITDPNDEIVEANEDNNALIFSDTIATVPGWQPEDLDVVFNGDGTIELPARRFGTVGAARFTVESGPQSGTLSSPVGSTVPGGVLTYRPDPGFVGVDEFTFSVRDLTSPFPLVAPTATVTIQVDDGADRFDADQVPPSVVVDTTFFEMEVGEFFETSLQAVAADGGDAELFAIGLPAGLTLGDGVLSGVATQAGFTDVELVAVARGAEARQTITLIVNPASEQGIAAQLDRQSDLQAPVSLRLGSTRLGARYEAAGLPGGLTIDELSPVVSGAPTEVGTFEVTVTESFDGETTREVSFAWTVHPSIHPGFPL